MVDGILINILRRKTKPKLVLKVRCRSKCKNISYSLLIERGNSHKVPMGFEKPRNGCYLRLAANPCTWRIDCIFKNVRTGTLFSSRKA